MNQTPDPNVTSPLEEENLQIIQKSVRITQWMHRRIICHKMVVVPFHIKKQQKSIILMICYSNPPQTFKQSQGVSLCNNSNHERNHRKNDIM